MHVLYWIDYDRKPVMYKLLNIRQTYEQSSYTNHQWVLFNERNNACIVFKLGYTIQFLNSGSTVRISDLKGINCDPREFKSLIKLNEPDAKSN